MTDEKEDRKPLTQYITLPTDEEIEEMKESGDRPYKKPEYGTPEWDRAYDSQSKVRALRGVIKGILDDALELGVITLVDVPGVLDNCKPDYHTALHQIRKENKGVLDSTRVAEVLQEIRNGS